MKSITKLQSLQSVSIAATSIDSDGVLVLTSLPHIEHLSVDIDLSDEIKGAFGDVEVIAGS